MSKIDPKELRRCIELLEAMVEDRTILSDVARAERVALMTAAGRLSRPTRHETVRFAKAFRRIKRKSDQESDRDAREATEIRAARRSTVFSAPAQLPPHAISEVETRELKKPRACYVCKAEFKKLHFFYDSMCPECAELNYQKRFQTASLEGRVALITGARVKIGFQAALMMLRAGARVIVTTRFPHDAAQRFAREADFGKWSDRLQVHGLDLRHCPSVELFARYLTQTEERLDILINNAAQTVRRPPAFYAHMLEVENRAHEDTPRELAKVLSGHQACKDALSIESLDPTIGDTMGLAQARDGRPGIGIRAAAQLSQMPSQYDEVAGAFDLFPVGKSDADLQQVDLRTMNSWRMALADVPTPEMLEVQLVNAVAPFILCSKLKPLMMRHPTQEKHIVNVSAMEGQFSRHTKTDKHPHTNMAKAALNMMTLTSAPDYAADGIFMNAVDTGWVTDEDPVALAARKREMHDFQPPLDIVDGAARVCDPFFSGLLTGVHVSGKFLKDYAPTSW
jgi:NAD(P)-dependent dehydrogenase (short-subunit alcohol dehydrogenase family)